MNSLTAEQSKAIEIIKNNKLVLFTGGPGVGKTFTISHLVKELNPIRTRCFAPTGRAAQRMMEAFDEQGITMVARTIHSGLMPDKGGYDGYRWRFKHNKGNPLKVDTVICDESSMCDNAILLALANAIPIGARLILVGDPDQLPPVGIGSPFLDMIKSGVIPHARLTEVHRFAGRIAHVCQQINRGEPWEPSEAIDLRKDAGPYGPENFRHVERRIPHTQLRSLSVVIDKVSEMGYDPFRDMQVLVARNTAGPVSRMAVNKQLQEKLNPHGWKVDGCPYREGDKLMCIKNGARTSYEVNDGDDSLKSLGETYNANGEIGICRRVESQKVYVEFPGNPALVLFGKPFWEKEVTMAYAITAHKSQGGGFPVVIMMIDDTRLCDRSLIYTAISRSKEMCITIGRKNLLDQQCQTRNVDTRKTFMCEMLQGIM